MLEPNQPLYHDDKEAVPIGILTSLVSILLILFAGIQVPGLISNDGEIKQVRLVPLLSI